MTEPRVEVVKYGATVPMSLEMALDYGVITEEEARARGWTPYVPPPVPWRRRTQARVRGWWDRRPRVHFGPCDHEDCGDYL